MQSAYLHYVSRPTSHKQAPEIFLFLYVVISRAVRLLALGVTTGHKQAPSIALIQVCRRSFTNEDGWGQSYFPWGKAIRTLRFLKEKSELGMCLNSMNVHASHINSLPKNFFYYFADVYKV